MTDTRTGRLLWCPSCRRNGPTFCTDRDGQEEGLDLPGSDLPGLLVVECCCTCSRMLRLCRDVTGVLRSAVKPGPEKQRRDAEPFEYNEFKVPAPEGQHEIARAQNVLADARKAEQGAQALLAEVAPLVQAQQIISLLTEIRDLLQGRDGAKDALLQKKASRRTLARYSDGHFS